MVFKDNNDEGITGCTITELIIRLFHGSGILDASSRRGWKIDTIYLDFAKAFDTVPHQRLLMILRGYGIEGRIPTWIEAFLADRRQRVVVNNSRSSWADVTSGIPQGSVLGPLLFICYINDMPSSVLSSIYLFADDAKLSRNISSDDDPPRTPARPSATGEMVREMAATFQLKQA